VTPNDPKGLDKEKDRRKVKCRSTNVEESKKGNESNLNRFVIRLKR